LAKGLFQLSDPDPRYANVTGLPVDNLWADLDFGTLTWMYDMLLPNVTGDTHMLLPSSTGGDMHTRKVLPNVMQYIFPTTPTELGPGWIIGRERIVSKTARSFTFPAGSSPLLLRYFDRQGWFESKHIVTGPIVHVAVDGGGARSFAVITAHS
jgi:hypothetical protein